jgi:hypothetical protein
MEVTCIKHSSRIYPKKLRKATKDTEWAVEPGISKVRIKSAVIIQLRHSANDEEVRIGEEAVIVFLKVQPVTCFENFPVGKFINPSL